MADIFLNDEEKGAHNQARSRLAETIAATEATLHCDEHGDGTVRILKDDRGMVTGYNQTNGDQCGSCTIMVTDLWIKGVLYVEAPPLDDPEEVRRWLAS